MTVEILEWGKLSDDELDRLDDRMGRRSSPSKKYGYGRTDKAETQRERMYEDRVATKSRR